MLKLLKVIARSAIYGLLGSVAGIPFGVLIDFLVGLCMGKPGFRPEGVLLGAWFGAATGVALSDPSEEWCDFLEWLWSRWQSWWAMSISPPAPKVELIRNPERATPPAPVEAKKPVVLFLCTRNSARSQMAEAFLKRYGGNRFAVYSAGLNPDGIHPLTVRVMSEAGIDLSGQHAKGLRQFLGRLPVRVAITVCQPVEPNCPTEWPGALAHLSWPFIDPAAGNGPEEEQLSRFRTVRDQIDTQIKGWLQEISVG